MLAKLNLSVEFYWITVAAGVWYTSSFCGWMSMTQNYFSLKTKKRHTLSHTHTNESTYAVCTVHRFRSRWFFSESLFSLKINEMKKIGKFQHALCSVPMPKSVTPRISRHLRIYIYTQQHLHIHIVRTHE